MIQHGKNPNLWRPKVRKVRMMDFSGSCRHSKAFPRFSADLRPGLDTHTQHMGGVDTTQTLY